MRPKKRFAKESSPQAGYLAAPPHEVAVATKVKHVVLATGKHNAGWAVYLLDTQLTICVEKGQSRRICDRNDRRQSESQADDRAQKPDRAEAQNSSLDGRSLRLESPRVVVESALEAHGARVLARSGDTPLLLVNEYGKGRALLLNLDISLCSKAVRVPFIGGLLEAVGVKHRFWLEGHDEARLHVLYRGAVTLLGVVLPDDSKKGVTLRWSDPSHVYDVRAGTHLGRRNELAVEAPATGRVVHLFALQSEPVRGVTLTFMDRIDAGATLSLQVHVESGAVDPASRLMRIDVVSPAGERIAHYHDFVTLDTQGARSDVPFAFNDMPGRWTIEATDVASGVSGTAVVEVR